MLPRIHSTYLATPRISQNSRRCPNSPLICGCGALRAGRQSGVLGEGGRTLRRPHRGWASSPKPAATSPQAHSWLPRWPRALLLDQVAADHNGCTVAVHVTPSDPCGSGARRRHGTARSPLTRFVDIPGGTSPAHHGWFSARITGSRGTSGHRGLCEVSGSQPEPGPPPSNHHHHPASQPLSRDRAGSTSTRGIGLARTQTGRPKAHPTPPDTVGSGTGRHSLHRRRFTGMASADHCAVTGLAELAARWGLALLAQGWVESHDSSFSKSAPASPPPSRSPEGQAANQALSGRQQRGRSRGAKLRKHQAQHPQLPSRFVALALLSLLGPGFKGTRTSHGVAFLWLSVKPQQQFPSPEQPMFASRPSAGPPELRS